MIKQTHNGRFAVISEDRVIDTFRLRSQAEELARQIRDYIS